MTRTQTLWPMLSAATLWLGTHTAQAQEAPTPMHLLLVALLGNETTRVAHAAALHTPIFEPTLILGWEL